ncbi:MAG: TIGR03087 family PEP-CTERM/XrtA system glycosyltransferase [Betaproteobacteria bacterium]
MEHLLFLSHRIPYPPNKGDKVRSWHWLKHLASRYRVHLGTFVDDEQDWQHVDKLRHLCGESFFAPLQPASAKRRSLSGLLFGQPLTLPYYRDAALQDWVNRVMETQPVRHILVYSSAMAQYVMPMQGRYRVADFVDVDSDKWRQYARTALWPLSAIYRREAKCLLRYERRVAAEFDATVFVSKAEAELFRRLAPESADKVCHADNGVDADYFSPRWDYPNPYPDKERVLAFTGAMDYRPNVDAVEWFANEVFPAIREAFPAACFYIVGARPTAKVQKLAELPGVRVTGTVLDIRPFIAHAEIAVAPLRLARGVQNKVLEAMAMAKTVIASPEAAEGIEARIGVELLVASSPAEFIATASALLDGKGRGRDVGVAGRERILASYGWYDNASRIERLFRESHSSSAVPGHFSAFAVGAGDARP